MILCIYDVISFEAQAAAYSKQKLCFEVYITPLNCVYLCICMCECVFCAPFFPKETPCVQLSTASFVNSKKRFYLHIFKKPSFRSFVDLFFC